MVDACKAAFTSHTAARNAKNIAAQAAARAAGSRHCNSPCGRHARHAAAYAVKAAIAAKITNDASAAENEWPYKHLPEHLRSAVFSPSKR